MFRPKIIGWVMTLPFLFSSCPAPTLLLPYMGFRKSIPWPDRISAWRVAGQLAGTSPKVLDLWWRNLWNAPNILKNPCKSMNPTAMAHNNRGHTPISNHWGNGPSPQPRGDLHGPQVPSFESFHLLFTEARGPLEDLKALFVEIWLIILVPNFDNNTMIPNSNHTWKWHLQAHSTVLCFRGEVGYDWYRDTNKPPQFADHFR